MMEGFHLKDVSFEHSNQLSLPLSQADKGMDIGPGQCYKPIHLLSILFMCEEEGSSNSFYIMSCCNDG